MSAAFSRSLRSLASDRPYRSLLLLGAALLFAAAWSAWIYFARVTVYEVSTRARIEVDREVHPVASQLSGRVVASNLQLGRAVQVGDLLVELDAETEKRRLMEERQRLAALEPELSAVRREMSATGQTLRNDRAATLAALDGARARQSELEAAAHFADEESSRLDKVHQKEGVSELEYLRVKAAERQKTAAAEAASLDLRRIKADQLTRDSQSQVRVEQLRRDAAKLEGQVMTTTANIRVLEEDVEKHTIRAPVSGQLGEVGALQIGAVLHEGERIGTVVPSGKLRLVAEFPPEAALGRIRCGQPARVRLDGFPWLQWGALDARVDMVAQEPRDGLLRVEFEVLPSPSTRIPLQHGLPGSVEVEVDHLSPAALILRVVGQWVTQPAVQTPGPAKVTAP